MRTKSRERWTGSDRWTGTWWTDVAVVIGRSGGKGNRQNAGLTNPRSRRSDEMETGSQAHCVMDSPPTFNTERRSCWWYVYLWWHSSTHNAWILMTPDACSVRPYIYIFIVLVISVVTRSGNSQRNIVQANSVLIYVGILVLPVDKSLTAPTYCLYACKLSFYCQFSSGWKRLSMPFNSLSRSSKKILQY